MPLATHSRSTATRFVNMKSMQILAAAAGLFAVANAWGTDIHTSYTTIVTTAYETYCPVSPIRLTHDDMIQLTADSLLQRLSTIM